jgi:hypothetical protein
MAKRRRKKARGKLANFGSKRAAPYAKGGGRRKQPAKGS